MELRARSAMAIREFRFLTFAAILLSFSSQVQSMTIGWQVYEIKHDPLYLGLIGLTEAVPGLTLALISGYIVDRSNPLKIYKNVVRIFTLAALLLLAISLPWTGLTPEKKLPFIYLAAFLAGTARGFSMPARTSLIPQLVPREILHISAAWTTAAFNIASITGPAVGGFIYAFKGPAAPYVLTTSALSVALIFLSRIRFRPKPAEAQKDSILANVTAGLKFVFNDQLLISALSMDMFAVLFGGAVALLPIFAGEILHVGPTGLGILRAAPAAGALLSSLFLVRFPVSRNSGKILLTAVTGFGFCMVGFALSKVFMISVLLLAVSGALDSFSMIIRGTIVQLRAPAQMRGRVGAVNSIFIGVSNQLGEFESGILAKLMGTVPSVIFGGAMTLVVVAAVGVMAPKLRGMHLDEL